LEALRIFAVAINPFMPLTSKNILEQLGIGADEAGKVEFSHIKTWGLLKETTMVKKAKPLFPRIEVS